MLGEFHFDWFPKESTFSSTGYLRNTILKLPNTETAISLDLL